MSTEIRQITPDDLRTMGENDGLILQGCGGDLNEWVEGITAQLTEAGILRNGSTFQKVSSFRNAGVTNLLFDFEGVEMNLGKLAVWRLATREDYGSMWLSDYVDNRLGGFIQQMEQRDQKPEADYGGVVYE